jgi:organic anion transporter 4A
LLNFLGFGALVFSLPYFTAGQYEFSNEVENICTNNLNDTSLICLEEFGGKLSNYKWVFFLGQFLHGVGGINHCTNHFFSKSS